MSDNRPRVAGPAPAKRPTMVHVARLAGVALSTVSRVVNADPTVGDAIVARVQAAIAESGYRVDATAQQLRRGYTGMLGAAIRSLTGTGGMVSEFQRAAHENNLMLLSAATEDDADLEQWVVKAMCRRIDGLLIEPIGDHHGYLRSEIEAGLPVVAVDRPAEGIEVDSVVSDNRGGIETAYRHLTAYGHRRIAYIGDSERIFTGRVRAAAFRHCVKRSGARMANMVHPGEVDSERIRAAVDVVLGGRWPATAIVSGNEMTTVELLQHLRDRSGTVAVVGFDDVPLARLLRPGLTVVTQGHHEIARKAFHLLMTRSSDPNGPIRRIEVATALIERGSAEFPPTNRM